MGSIFSRCRSTNSICKLTDYFPKVLAHNIQTATTIIPKLCYHNGTVVILTSRGHIIMNDKIIMTHVVDLVSELRSQANLFAKQYRQMCIVND